MQKSKKIICIFIFSLLGIIALLVTYGQSKTMFEKVKKIPLIGCLYSYNFPPADYYVPLVRVPLQGIDKIDAQCQYSGRYDIHIVNVKTNLLENANIAIKISFRNKNSGEVYWETEKDKPCLLAYTSKDGCEGFRYWYDAFVSPSDVPINIPMSIIIECCGDIENFLHCHPEAVIEVRKSFDK